MPVKKSVKKTYVPKYAVTLSAPEKEHLRKLLHTGKHPARTTLHARILLLADQGTHDDMIGHAVDMSGRTVRNVRKRYDEGGLPRALYDAPRTGQPAVLSVEEKTKITAIACTDPPDGYGRWTLDLLVEKVGKEVKSVGRSTIHRVLLASDLKPWREKNVVHPNDR